MRSLSVAVLTAAALVTVAAPVQATTVLLPPLGHYSGLADGNKRVSFSLVHDHGDLYKVVHFKLNGHQQFASTKFHYGSHTYGWFTVFTTTGHHYWGHWTADYGHLTGGYAYTSHGERVTLHFTAKADGF